MTSQLRTMFCRSGSQLVAAHAKFGLNNNNTLPQIQDLLWSPQIC